MVYIHDYDIYNKLFPSQDDSKLIARFLLDKVFGAMRQCNYNKDNVVISRHVRSFAG
jgi:hypothetical protein